MARRVDIPARPAETVEMRRLLASLLTVTVLCAPAAARAAGPPAPTGGSSLGSGSQTSATGGVPVSGGGTPVSAGGASSPAHGASPAHGVSPVGGGALPASGTLRGAVVSVGWSQLTLRPRGRTMPVVAALTAGANAVAAGDYPYVWGGGHPAAGMPSAAHAGGPVGYDCSGSVAAVLAGAGLWPAGTGVPSDAGLIATLRSEHVIAAGTGAVTLWDDPGQHIFLQIETTFFGTSDGAGPSPANPNGGAGWLDDGAADTLSPDYHPWHIAPAALATTVSYGPTVTLGVSGPVAEDAMTLAVGDRVAVSYVTRARALVAASVAGP